MEDFYKTNASTSLHLLEYIPNEIKTVDFYKSIVSINLHLFEHISNEIKL